MWADNTRNVVDYTGILPENRVFHWGEIGKFPPNKNILMHSVHLPHRGAARQRHGTAPSIPFYVDNLFVYQPLPQVNTIYYLNLDLYRYFIGREDQSVNEKNMIKRVDQQLRVTRLMMDAVDVFALPPEQEKLRAYMLNYFSMMMGDLQHLPGAGWQRRGAGKSAAGSGADLKAHDERLYRRCRHSVAPGVQSAGLAGLQAQHRRLPHCSETVQIQLRERHAAVSDHPVRPGRHAYRFRPRHPQLGAVCPAANWNCPCRKKRSCAASSARRCPPPFRSICIWTRPGPGGRWRLSGNTTPRKGIFENEVYPGIPALLAALKGAGRRVVMATSKPEVFARRIMEHFSLEGYFDAICGATIDERRTDKGDVIAYALETAGVTDLQHTVMVGDREHDVKGAARNGLPCIGRAVRLRQRAAELHAAGAVALAGTVADLHAMLLHG